MRCSCATRPGPMAQAPPDLHAAFRRPRCWQVAQEQHDLRVGGCAAQPATAPLQTRRWAPAAPRAHAAFRSSAAARRNSSATAPPSSPISHCPRRRPPPQLSLSWGVDLPPEYAPAAAPRGALTAPRSLPCSGAARPEAPGPCLSSSGQRLAAMPRRQPPARPPPRGGGRQPKPSPGFGGRRAAAEK